MSDSVVRSSWKAIWSLLAAPAPKLLSGPKAGNGTNNHLITCDDASPACLHLTPHWDSPGPR